MKKYLFLYAVVVTASLIYAIRPDRHENRRLEQNQTALSTELLHYRTSAGVEVASVQVRRLRCSEFERIRTEDAAAIRNLGLKLRRVEGLMDRDSVACRVESVDTLRQVIHRIPRRFLFIRGDTKAIRQQIVGANPHTRIVFSEYIKIERDAK